MELKRLITHFTYRIEPKPEGGFIAHATDPTVPPLEAPTREELQQKIQANIATALAAEFPGLKLPLENRQLKYAFHIELKPGGGFAIHSADPGAKPVQGATHEEIESHFAEKLIGFVGKTLYARAVAGARHARQFRRHQSVREPKNGSQRTRRLPGIEFWHDKVPQPTARFNLMTPR